MRGRQGGLVGIVALAGLVSAGAACAADRLTEAGARLEPEIIADRTRAVVVRTIDLGGDVPTATYVIAKDFTNRLMQRTNDGYWIPWDSQMGSLVDNRLVARNGKLTVKVFAEDISAAQFPLSVTLAYKVGDKFKYGVFPILVTP